MALQLNFNTPVNSDSGTSLLAVYARLDLSVDKSETSVVIKIYYYENEQAYLDNRNQIQLDEIPNDLNYISAAINGGQYANIDMTSVHNQYKDILLNGSNANNYPEGADQSWLGLLAIDPLNTIIVEMPI